MSQTLTRLSPEERNQVRRLFRSMSHHHQHLDWYHLDRWLDDPGLTCWTLQRSGVVEALLGATLNDPMAETPEDNVAWLRFAIPSQQFEYDSTLDTLWLALRRDLQTIGVSLLSLLAIEDWIAQYARRWGFVETTAVITLRRDGNRSVPTPAQSYPIRDAGSSDMDAVVQVDGSAFDPLWRYNDEILSMAASQAEMFRVIEVDNRIVAYQLSTRYTGSGHLARLAVMPEMQNRGLGGVLMSDMVRYFQDHNIRTLTVNTQSDNRRSYRLYTRYGFSYTGHRVPVWMLEL